MTNRDYRPSDERLKHKATVRIPTVTGDPGGVEPDPPRVKFVGTGLSVLFDQQPGTTLEILGEVLDSPAAGGEVIPVRFAQANGVGGRGSDWKWVDSLGVEVTGDSFILAAGQTTFSIFIERITTTLLDALTVGLVQQSGSTILSGAVIDEPFLARIQMPAGTGTGTPVLSWAGAPGGIPEANEVYIAFLQLSEPAPAAGVQVQLSLVDNLVDNAEFAPSGTTRQVTFPQGSTQQQVRVIWDDNVTVETGQTITLTMVSAVGATVPGAPDDDLVLSIANDDTGVPGTPVFEFATAGGVAIEGGQVLQVGVNLVSGVTPAGGLTVTYTRTNITGTPTAGIDYRVIPTNGITMTQGQIQGIVSCLALDNGVADTQDRVVRLTLQAGAGYTLGTQTTFDLTLREPASGAGDTTITADLSSTGDTFVQAITHIDPTPITALPDFWINDIKADVFAVTPIRGNITHAVQVCAPVPAGTTDVAMSDAGTTAFPPVSQYDDVDLSGLVLSMWGMPNLPGGVMHAPLGNLVELFKSGVYQRDEHWYSRAKSTHFVLDQYGAGVHFFVDRRPDGIMLSVAIDNACYRPRPANLFAIDNDPAVRPAGRIYFTHADLRNIPAGYEIVGTDEDPSMDVTRTSFGVRAPAYIKETAGSQHWMPTGAGVIRHYFLYETANVTATEAQEKADLYGHGFASSGPFSIHNRPGWGPNVGRVPDFNGTALTMQNVPGVTGRSAIVERSERDLAKVLLNVTAGQSTTTLGAGAGNDYFGRDLDGWWFPGGPRRPGTSGGSLINWRSGVSLDRAEMRFHRIMLSYLFQREYSRLTDSITGRQVEVSELAAHNGGLMPWSFNPKTEDVGQWENQQPVLQEVITDPNVNTGAVKLTTRRIAPTDNLWNTPTPGVPITSDDSDFSELNSFTTPAFGTVAPDFGWQSIDHDHASRFLGVCEYVVCALNAGWAKWIAMAEGKRFERASSYIEHDETQPLTFNSPFTSRSNSMQNIVEVLTNEEPAKQNFGQVQPATGGDMFQSRGQGGLDFGVALGYVSTPPGQSARTETENWSDVWSNAADLLTTLFGCGDRRVAGLVGGGPLLPYDLTTWGASNPAARTGCCPSQGTSGDTGGEVLPDWTAAQAFMGCFRAYGGACVHRALLAAGSTERTKAERFVYTFLTSMWVDARRSGETQAPAFMISSTGQNGIDDAALATPYAWAFTNVAGTSAPAILDNRQFPLMGASLNAAIALGNTTMRSNILTWVALYHGTTTTGTDVVRAQAAADAMISSMSIGDTFNRSELTMRYDLLGALQQIAADNA